jgi:hypothetical protein
VTNLLGQAQGLVLLVVGLVVLALAVWSLVEAVRYAAPSYVAAGKQTKPLWVALTAVASALAFVAVQSPLNLPGILAAGASVYFLVGVRPALAAVQGRGRSNDGPYGSW